MTKEGMDEPTIPRFLFKYRTFKDTYRSLETILTKNLWHIGSRVDFDDKDDCRVPRIDVSREYLEGLASSPGRGSNLHLERRIEQMLSDPVTAERRAREECQRIVNGVGIFCLSELPDHAELWKKYADDGRGVVLGLDMTKVAFTEPFRLRGPFEVTTRMTPRRSGTH